MSNKIIKDESPESTLNNKVVNRSGSEILPSVLPDICHDSDNLIEFKPCDGKQTIAVSLTRLRNIFAIKVVGSPKRLLMFSADGELISSGILLDDTAGVGGEILIVTSANSNKLENKSLSQVINDGLVAIRDGVSGDYDTLKDVETHVTGILASITDIINTQLPLKATKSVNENITGNWTFTTPIDGTATNSNKLDNKSFIEVKDDIITTIISGYSAPGAIGNGAIKIAETVRTVTGEPLTTPADIYLIFNGKNISTIGIELYNCSVETAVYLNGILVSLSDMATTGGAFIAKTAAMDMSEDMVLHIKLGYHVDGTTKHPAYAHLVTDSSIPSIGHKLFRIANVIGTASVTRY